MKPPPAPAPELPRRGDIVGGKYRIEDILGVGGMGVVVAAWHLALRQRVAMKFLLPAATRLPDASARFLREARAAAAIRSEHVARVLDVGELANGAAYMVMEHLVGKDLLRLLNERGPLAVDDAVDFVLQAGEAIAEAHTLGIVHRDLKPGNIFLTARPDGSPLVKVLDFGLSKMEDEEMSGGCLTTAALVAGSPHYMSPEQLRSLKCVDMRSDVWALGVILYELVTGRRPFGGPNLPAICASIIADTPTPMRALRPDLPETLEAAVNACLEKQLEQRISGVPELSRALSSIAPSRSAASVERISKLGDYAAPTRLSEKDLELVCADDRVPRPSPQGANPSRPPFLLGAPPLTPAPALGEGRPATTTLQPNAWGRTGTLRLPQRALLIGVVVAVLLLGAGTLASMSALRGVSRPTSSNAPAAEFADAPAHGGTATPSATSLASSVASLSRGAGSSTSSTTDMGALPAELPPSSMPRPAGKAAPTPPPSRPRPKRNPLDSPR